MQALQKFAQPATQPAAPQFIQPEQEFEIAMRPPAPRSEGWQATPPTPPPPSPPAHIEPEDTLGIDGEFSGNVALTTEYTFRGITQSREGPAIQGGVDYEHPSGGYVGLWASSIDFGDQNASTEMDYYAGYSQEIGGGVTADGGFIYYNYPSAKSNLNYDFVEGYLGLEYVADVQGQEVTTNATVNYSPDYFAASGQGVYAKLAASTPVAYGFTVDGHIARQWVEDEAAFLFPDYNDWSLGVGYELEGYELKAQYVDTSLDSSECADGCDAKGILSVSKAL